jgi:sirohydrochlorin cobaltochelatase
MSPGLEAAAEALCAQGCTTVHVLPLFLGTGGHLRNDVPPLIEALRGRHPDRRFELHPAAGEHAAVVQAMAATALSLIGQAPR